MKRCTGWSSRRAGLRAIANDFGFSLAPLHVERFDTRSVLPLVLSKSKASGWLHEELTRRIIGVCFEVSNELGAGFLESVYHQALLIALRDNGLEAQSGVPIKVHFRGHEVGSFVADILVDQRVLVEVKAVRALVAEHQAQVINYLKATAIEVGLLINFGRPKLEVRRHYR